MVSLLFYSPVVYFCRMALGYVVLILCPDTAYLPPISLPDHREESNRNQQQTCFLYTSPYYRFRASSYKLDLKSVIVLSDESELLPHPVDGLADVRRRVVPKNHHDVVLRSCQAQ